MKINGAHLQLYRGDITEHEVDAIVNAANARLAGGGGVDGAIHAAGGASIMAECRQLGGCPVGQAVVTGAGKLKAKHVIHTVGPMWTGGDHNEDDLLRSAYQQSLRQAVEHMARTVAFPSISTGAYGFPIKRAARIAVQAVIDFLQTSKSIESVRFVLFTQDDLDIYHQAMTDLIRRPKLGCWFDFFTGLPALYGFLHLSSADSYGDCLKLLRDLSREPNWQADTLRLLGQRNWRGHLPASLSIYLSGLGPTRPVLSEALWATVERRSWVAPQLLCVLSEIDSDFPRNAASLLNSDWHTKADINAPYIAKVANSLRTLSELKAWQAGDEMKTRLADLATQDIDAADEIVESWLSQLRALGEAYA